MENSENQVNLFEHVHKDWQKKCLSYDQVFEKATKQNALVKDIVSPLNDWEPNTFLDEKNRPALRNKKTGKIYSLTYHALNGLCKTSTVPFSGVVTGMLNNGQKRETVDAELVCQYLNRNLFNPSCADLEKPLLFRTWDSDGDSQNTIRAILSTSYVVINNLWYLDILRSTIPQGVFSHWRGNADILCANLLIPDTMRQEQDSEVGGMLSIGNNEIGTGRITSLPSVFRAICMNGTIMGQQEGMKISKIHMGKIDFDNLKNIIIENLNKTIPLLSANVDTMLASKDMKINAPIDNILSLVAMENKLTKKIVKTLKENYLIEHEIIGKDVHSAYGLNAAITRTGQTLSNDQWFSFDMLAGHICSMQANSWQSFMNRANNLTEKQIKKYFALSN